MGRKPVLGVAGALLTSLALAGCQNSPSKPTTTTQQPITTTSTGVGGQNTATIKNGTPAPTSNVGAMGGVPPNSMNMNTPTVPTNSAIVNPPGGPTSNISNGNNAGYPPVGTNPNPSMNPPTYGAKAPATVPGSTSSNLGGGITPQYQVGTNSPQNVGNAGQPSNPPTTGSNYQSFTSIPPSPRVSGDPGAGVGGSVLSSQDTPAPAPTPTTRYSVPTVPSPPPNTFGDRTSGLQPPSSPPVSGPQMPTVPLPGGPPAGVVMMPAGQ
jgi:hypothetical protein